MPKSSTQRRRNEALAVGALLLATRRYSLPALVRQQGIRPRPFRRITPTQALAGSIAAPHLSIAEAWAAERDYLLAAYGSDNAAILRAVETTASRVAGTVQIAKQRFAPTLARVEQWHRVQWLQRVKATTGLDVAMFTTAGDAAPELRNAVAWNQQLADDVHQQTKHRVGAALLAAAAIGAPMTTARANVSAAVAKARRRAAAIGVDQVEKVSGGMTRARMAAADIEQWRWRHLDPQKHPRPEHQARDGRLYSVANQPNDLPGVLPFCQCWTEPMLG